MRSSFHVIAVVAVAVGVATGCNLLKQQGEASDAAASPSPTPVYPEEGKVEEAPVAVASPAPAAQPEAQAPAQAAPETPASPSPASPAAPENMETQADWCHAGCKRIFECRGDLQAAMGGAKKFSKSFGDSRESCNKGCLEDTAHAPTTACKACMSLSCDAFAPCVVKECFPEH